jgi:hypothetical protein
MKISAALAILAGSLSACALPRPEEREIGVRHQDLAGDVEARIQVQSSLVTHYVDAPVESAWTVLADVYDEMEIPLSVYEPETMTVGNRGFTPKTIGGARMSRYLECGASTTGRPYADAYKVEMYLVTRVDGAGPTRARIMTEIYATARSRDTSGNRIQCPTKGLLERRIAEMITEKVGS